MPFHVPEDKRIQNADEYSDAGWMNSGSFDLGWVQCFATEDEEFEVVHIEKPDMPRREINTVRKEFWDNGDTIVQFYSSDYESGYTSLYRSKKPIETPKI